jgi:thioredoxin-like negative regulator of GroEL
MAKAKSKTATDGKLHDVTDHTFEKEVIQCGLPVFLVFGASWCEQREGAPDDPDHDCLPRKVLEQVAASYQGVRIAFMDVENSSTIPAEYEVAGIPRVMFFGVKGDRRQPSRMLTGRMTQQELVDFIEDDE